MKFIALPTTAIANLISQAKIIVSSRVSVLPWLYWPYPFYLGPPPKNSKSVSPPPPLFLSLPFLSRPPPKNSKSVSPPPPLFLSNPPQNFGELYSPLEMYPCPKIKDSFCKETKYFNSNNEMRTHLKDEI